MKNFKTTAATGGVATRAIKGVIFALLIIAAVLLAATSFTASAATPAAADATAGGIATAGEPAPVRHTLNFVIYKDGVIDNNSYIGVPRETSIEHGETFNFDYVMIYGYALKGFYVNGAEFGASTPITEDTTVNCMFEAKDWFLAGEDRITLYITPDMTGQIEQVVFHDVMPGEPLEKYLDQITTPRLPGQVFLYWQSYVFVEGDREYFEVTEDTHVIDGKSPAHEMYLYSVFMPHYTTEIPIRKGYTYGGLYYDEAFTEPYDPARTDNNNVYFYAKWIPQMHRVNFDTAGGTPVAYQQIDYNTAPILPITAKPGFTLAGWTLDGKPYLAGQKLRGAERQEFTLTAVWEEVKAVPPVTEKPEDTEEPPTVEKPEDKNTAPTAVAAVPPTEAALQLAQHFETFGIYYVTVGPAVAAIAVLILIFLLRKRR